MKDKIIDNLLGTMFILTWIFAAGSAETSNIPLGILSVVIMGIVATIVNRRLEHEREERETREVARRYDRAA